MKPDYSDLTIKTGPLVAGIVTIQVAPREWLAAIIDIDYNTGKVITPVSFIAGKNWINFSFAPKTYEYDDKPKSNKSGAYREISVSGIFNYYDAAVQQTVNTLRYHELVAKVMDKNKRIRLIGNTEAGLAFSDVNSIKNAEGKETLQISLIMESEDSPPFYEIN